MIRTTRFPLGIALAGALAVLVPGTAFAWGGGGGGGGDAGSGLSPYAALNGNDRSAGVNNGNFRDPRSDPYLRTYDPAAVEAYGERPVRTRPRVRIQPYDGYPY